MFKKFLTAIVALVAVLSIAGCKKDDGKKVAYKEATGYGIVHKDYVGMAEMTVIDGKVARVLFDEAFLPYTWAQVKVAGETVPSDVLEYTNSKGATVYNGKYIKIGDKLFTGSVREKVLVVKNVSGEDIEVANQKVKYSADGIDDLYTWLKASEANCEWYVNELKAGKAYVAKQDGQKASYEFNNMGGFFKSSTNYWAAGSVGLGWAENLRALAIAIQGTNMSTALTKIVKEEGTWKIDNTVSKATLTDFKDYYVVAQNAFKTATK